MVIRLFPKCKYHPCSVANIKSAAQKMERERESELERGTEKERERDRERERERERERGKKVCPPIIMSQSLAHENAKMSAKFPAPNCLC